MTDLREPDDLQDAVVAVAEEMDAQRTLQDRIRDTGRAMELCLMLLRHRLGGV
jgi:hypothetical protein